MSVNCGTFIHRDTWKRRYRQIVAIDALDFKNPKEQYTKDNIKRELNKVLVFNTLKYRCLLSWEFVIRLFRRILCDSQRHSWDSTDSRKQPSQRATGAVEPLKGILSSKVNKDKNTHGFDLEKLQTLLMAMINAQNRMCVFKSSHPVDGCCSGGSRCGLLHI